ncbi:MULTISPECIES: hypothetical protein [Exiguobacterium]|uniref:hypothetical protein n=1 Tax=Exiguobacterium TaxID=33986 RepID=UPI000493F519|nr:MULTISPECIES: hypothetical protein [Exiguobacterium]KNH31770.1 hypothetical protein ACS74_15750 [Exiguobacterium acetylicum]HCD57805.1 hypothetical protein [Exiguobacterium sp.]
MKKWIAAGLVSSLAFGVMQTSIVEASSSSKEVAKLKKEKAALQKQLADEKKKTKKSENAYKTLQGQHTSLSKSYKSLDTKYKNLQIENEGNKKKIKELSTGYRLLASSKSLVTDGAVVTGKYKNTESLLMLGKTPYVPLQLLADLSGLPLIETSTAYEVGTPLSGTSLSSIHIASSSFESIEKNQSILANGKLNNQNVILSGFFNDEYATFSLDRKYKKLSGQLSLLTEQALTKSSSDLNYASPEDEMTLVFSDNNGKELGRYDVVYGADEIDFDIDVTGVANLRVTAEGNSTVTTLISPVLTK